MVKRGLSDSESENEDDWRNRDTDIESSDSSDENEDNDEQNHSDSNDYPGNHKKVIKDRFQASDSEEDDDYDAEFEKHVQEARREMEQSAKKLKQLTPEQLAKEQKKIKRSGVVYLSTIPPYMKPAKLRHVLQRFGKVGRLYLKPEDPKVYKARVKTGGNKKKKFVEGWCEFENKNDAKLAAETLNGNKLGGKKGNFYYDDIMNIKYLKGFKWHDLTEAMNREIEIRESKMQSELSQAHKINKNFIKNVETSKMIENIKKRKKNVEPTVQRVYAQRSVTTNRAGADASQKDTKNTESGKLKKVLENIF
ncbi:hypothetical protein KL925_003350 [Ogataea polymorpha]|nr:hypothetical protein KL937_003000 [Ogataea polymorpha]KAG7899614.1 hypothetical protein KL907_004966 [Ogataea polymorpha]KAG7900148.1 hypothetical protein KL935_002891 [Ogataea polymorpha]KAG7909078.1 hypothetical protein KL906_002572 [Ogataea polymorpha]KAG7916189.1 hypothetical protein KL927_003654 [Ogataea polymorpha]